MQTARRRIRREPGTRAYRVDAHVALPNSCLHLTRACRFIACHRPNLKRQSSPNGLGWPLQLKHQALSARHRLPMRGDSDMTEPPTSEQFNSPAQQPRLDPYFPITLARLREIYSRATLEFELQRRSFGDLLSGSPDDTSPLRIESKLTELEPPPPRPIADLIQRHFYWSSTCFYRSFYLMLAYFSLDRKPMRSWAHVTAYYCRLYSIKAIMNLFFTNIVAPRVATDKRRSESLIYLTMEGVKALPLKKVYSLWNIRGSHQVWWALFREMQHVPDFPETDESLFALTDSYFNPSTRNTVNYSEQYLEGFP